MTDTPEVHHVYVHIKPCSRALPTGQVAYGFYTLVDGVVTMTDEKGNVAMDDDGKVYTAKLEGEDANVIAGRLTMKLRDALRSKNRDGAPSGFSGPLNYPKSVVF